MATTPSAGAQNTIEIEQTFAAALSQMFSNSNHPQAAALASQAPALIQIGAAVAQHPNGSNIMMGLAGLLQALCGAGVIKF